MINYVHENDKVLAYKILYFLFDHMLQTNMNWKFKLFADPSAPNSNIRLIKMYRKSYPHPQEGLEVLEGNAQGEMHLEGLRNRLVSSDIQPRWEWEMRLPV